MTVAGQSPTGYGYDAANRLATINDQSLVYDANGNLIEKHETTGTTSYTWDARNRLVAIEGPDVSARFKYDAFNRRIEKTLTARRSSINTTETTLSPKWKRGS